jgi:hypothetical protein
LTSRGRSDFLILGNHLVFAHNHDSVLPQALFRLGRSDLCAQHVELLGITAGLAAAALEKSLNISKQVVQYFER